MRPHVVSYDLDKFDFVTAVREALDAGELGQLGVAAQHELFTRATDQSTEFHAKFYSAYGSAISQLYIEFIGATIPEILQTDEFCFQKVPTFRVHLPNNVAVGEFHRDADYNHADGAVNFWLPLTRTWDSNSVWIERNLGDEDYVPFDLVPGQLLVFDGVNWRHGNRVNTTGQTRVSFDFRCIPMAKYTDSDRRTVNTGRALRIGEYYELYRRQ
jgi:hypothetical protein